MDGASRSGEWGEHEVGEDHRCHIGNVTFDFVMATNLLTDCESGVCALDAGVDAGKHHSLGVEQQAGFVDLIL